MYFKLGDGKPVWALGKTTITEEVRNKETTREREIYLYTTEELSQYPDAELIEQPTPEILVRAAQIEGKTLSKSEFERMLYEKTPMEQMQETLDMLVLDSLGGT